MTTPSATVAVNQLVLTAQIVESSTMRYTPSGVPALNCLLEHASEALEASQVRQVKALLKSVSFGSVAERLAQQEIGSSWLFKGFLASPRGTKQLVFHVQEFAQN
ncbi:primosomal replication protein N [Rhodoferax sp.]|uniref:primosomal replication protein N n=1 Tax=Rhodoferax sp. TaxID=50421 RepID=UPI00271D3D06|nr:primosomal replication protein N [Rhodoferax sp.]MDO9144570.1 primosomal replication protein N [Rhodoferax sp.]MDP1529149.1 primosomal replication protein N [Rhodoferax sp.]MDP1944024.1 primosomal replication protein N [Rhodoferax sp.]MDP2441617.1 primosomal replication protein N [Rhodoferax sp.]MDZ4206953.1 primosomal replication protein N [Rhodoferax sp.]